MSLVSKDILLYCVYVNSTHIALEIFYTLLSLLIIHNDISVCKVGTFVTCTVLFENWLK
jgi:hypothetical protein